MTAPPSSRRQATSADQAAGMIGLRSLLFNLLFYATMVVLMILGLATILGGRRAVLALARLWGAISVWLLAAICGLRLEYRGVDNIPPGGVIVAVKHQSFLETFALLKYAPDFAIILKRQLTYIPLFGLYLIVSKQIAIDRGRGRRCSCRSSPPPSWSSPPAVRFSSILRAHAASPVRRRSTRAASLRLCRDAGRVPASGSQHRSLFGGAAAFSAARASRSSSICPPSLRASRALNSPPGCRRRSKARAIV